GDGDGVPRAQADGFQSDIGRREGPAARATDLSTVAGCRLSVAEERLGAGVQRKVLYAVLGVGMVVCGAVAWPFTKAHLKAVAVMREVSGQPVPALARELTVPVTTQDVSFPIETADGQGLVRARI